ncbi:hypothetical protein DdX_03329 [Ditylenchus destructor]|uniref:Uncharacterized protein n=1 Tax=Ditylenchus destructor TaxID=166010 RepID=A0AAD4NJ46_9BILA|nr:hypothetical protein DdX_03329 [Ditylenchus destructor]
MSLPSTSKAHATYRRQESTTSPISPVGRIAKRNAMKLNEVDITNMGSRNVGRLENFAAMPPNLKMSSLQDKLPIISAQETILSMEQQIGLQKASEDIMAEINDNMRILHGEVRYLESGEYPTVDLSTKIKPQFDLKPRARRLTEQNSIGQNILNELALNSSPEDEEDTHASILDIPKRWWTWTRPYLRHVDDDFIKQFKVKVVDRFDEANLDKFLNQGSGSGAMSRKVREENGISHNGKLGSQTSKATKRRINHEDNPLETPSRINRRDTRISRSKPESPSKVYLATNVVSSHQKEKDHKPKDKQVSFTANGVESNVNNSYEDCNGYIAQCNGIKTEKANGYLPSAPHSPVGSIAEQDVKKFAYQLAMHGAENGYISPQAPSELLNDINDESTANGLLNGDQDDDDGAMDEVSRELKKKQKELRDLLHKTKPIIMQLYERAEAERAFYQCSQNLDAADDKLFELARKYEQHEGLFTPEERKECVDALNNRERCAALFNAEHHRSLQFQRLMGAPTKK